MWKLNYTLKKIKARLVVVSKVLLVPPTCSIIERETCAVLSQCGTALARYGNGVEHDKFFFDKYCISCSGQ